MKQYEQQQAQLWSLGFLWMLKVISVQLSTEGIDSAAVGWEI